MKLTSLVAGSHVRGRCIALSRYTSSYLAGVSVLSAQTHCTQWMGKSVLSGCVDTQQTDVWVLSGRVGT